MNNYKLVGDYLSGSECQVDLKDLGPQLPYRLLFIIEYLGPLITIPLLYYFAGNRSLAAKYGAILGFAHFLKRELESEFVHIFSNASVPVSGSVKNIVHYWVSFGLLTVGEIFFFRTPANDWPKKYYYGFAGLWAVFQLLNLRCHIILRKLRVKSDGKVEQNKRGIPKGCGFDMVHCANYLWEILGWTTYSVMTKSYMGILFTLFGAAIMAVWAQGKKAKLLKCYKDDEELHRKLKRKKALFPLLY